MAEEVAWHYAADDSSFGPVDQAGIEEMIRGGRLRRDWLVWREGMPSWARADATELASIFDDAGIPPPLPPHVAAPLPLAAVPPPLPDAAAATGWSRTAPDPAPIPAGTFGGPAPARGFGEAVRYCFRNWLTFSGRGSRSEYWYFVLFIFLGGVVTALLDAILLPQPFVTGSAQSPVLNGIFSLAVFIPHLAAMSRRYHDGGWSFWWVLLWLIPIVNIVFFLIVATSRPEPRPNYFDRT